MDRETRLKALVEVLPDSPGVYQYYDEKGEIIYVGKAKNLKRRVSSYFMNKRHNLKTNILVAKISDIKHIVVSTEKDAFLLENTLIKKYKPRYNILLKDDKTYPWIKIVDEPFPRVIVTRNFVRDGGKYFGPYTSGSEIKFLFEIIKNNYHIRTCNLLLDEKNVSRGTYRECLDYHVKKCNAPCTGKISREDYARDIAEIRLLLKGNFSYLVRRLRVEMIEAAEKLNFEHAEECKKRLEAFEKYQEHSVVTTNTQLNIDVFGFARAEKNKTFVNYIKVQEGKISESFTMTFEHIMEEENTEILFRALQEVRNLDKTLQQEIVVREAPAEDFENKKFTVPSLGDKIKILELAEKNAQTFKFEYLRKEATKNKTFSREEKLLLSIKEQLDLEELPRHIEIFDNSNIQGSTPVAACVVFKNCRPSKNDYRKYDIKTVEGPDDYASMYEVAHRRYARLIEEQAELPNLIVADGGLGQMEVLDKVLQELNLSIPILGLAKDNKHRTSEILLGIPPKKIDIKKYNDIFRFFARMQEEVHRFAISFHRQKREKKMIVSELDSITGIGEKTKEILMKEFKSIDNIKLQSLESLENIIDKRKARILYNYFHATKNT